MALVSSVVFSAAAVPSTDVWFEVQRDRGPPDGLGGSVAKRDRGNSMAVWRCDGAQRGGEGGGTNRALRWADNDGTDAEKGCRPSVGGTEADVRVRGGGGEGGSRGVRCPSKRNGGRCCRVRTDDGGSDGDDDDDVDDDVVDESVLVSSTGSGPVLDFRRGVVDVPDARWWYPLQANSCLKSATVSVRHPSPLPSPCAPTRWRHNGHCAMTTRSMQLWHTHT